MKIATFLHFGSLARPLSAAIEDFRINVSPQTLSIRFRKVLISALGRYVKLCIEQRILSSAARRAMFGRFAGCQFAATVSLKSRVLSRSTDGGAMGIE